MLKICMVFVISFLFMISFAYSQKVEFSGWGMTGIKVYDRNILQGYSQEMFYEGKLQSDIEYNDNHREAVHLIFTTEIFFQDSIDF